MKMCGLVLPVFILATSAYSISQVANSGFDPLREVQQAFPDTVAIKNHRKLLEFCPDGTCDGFVTSGVPLATLKDFAYLYIYFFSDNVTLDDWKSTAGAKEMADRVLGQSQYLACKEVESRETARCVLSDLSRNGRIRLIFVRYDEGERHAIPEDLQEKLATSLAQKCEALTFPPRNEDSQPLPSQLMIPNAARTVRDVSCFSSFNQDSTMIDVVRKCGLPDKHMEAVSTSSSTT